MNPTAYALRETASVLDNENRTYILKVRDLPAEEKPRERLLKYGPSVLSAPELLAILMGAGTKKEEVLTMASRIMKEYGEKSIVSERDAGALSRGLGIPIVKAMQIVACFELGRRFFKRDGNGRALVRNARDAFEYLRDMRDLSKEHLRGIYINSHHKVIHDEVISIGTVDANLIHPREVFKPALEYSAAALILAHNHPSGVLKASNADIEVTRQLVTAGKILGISLLDHIIITKTKFLSIKVDYQ
jgi:DNA repair protein RadC